MRHFRTDSAAEGWLSAWSLTVVGCAAVTVRETAHVRSDASGAERQVVLPTGERVLLDQGQVAGVIAQGGTGAPGYDVITRGGGTRVIPHSARNAIANGTLDAAQFTVTEPGRDLPPPASAHAAETAQLTLDVTDRRGLATKDWAAEVMHLETFESFRMAGGDGPLEVPVGDYAVATLVYEGLAWDEYTGMDYLLLPHAPVRAADVALDLSAAGAREIDLSVPDEEARLTTLSFGFELGRKGSSDRHWTLRHIGDLPRGFRTAQLGPVADGYELSSSVNASWLNGDREFHTASALTGGFHTGLTQHSEWQDLARIDAHVGVSRDGAQSLLFTAPSVPYFTGVGFAPAPFSREVYVRADAGTWETDVRSFSHRETYLAYETGAHRYEPGGRYQERFGTGVFGPLISCPDDGLFREGNTIGGTLTLLADGSGHHGFGDFDTATTTLYRDGEVYAAASGVLDDVTFEVPAEEANYRLVTRAARESPGAVSTEVTAAYTFISAESTGRLPASAVRFTPELALDSTSPGGRTINVPVTVQGSAAGENLASLHVSVSFDGGETWKHTRVQDGHIRVTNPESGGTVSFRAKVADRHGNTLTQTIIDAYRTS